MVTQRYSRPPGPLLLPAGVPTSAPEPRADPPDAGMWRSGAVTGDDGAMVGAVVIAIVLVVAIPVGVLMSGGIASALLGFVLKEEAETAHEGSELIETNR